MHVTTINSGITTLCVITARKHVTLVHVKKCQWTESGQYMRNGANARPTVRRLGLGDVITLHQPMGELHVSGVLPRKQSAPLTEGGQYMRNGANARPTVRRLGLGHAITLHQPMGELNVTGVLPRKQRAPLTEGGHNIRHGANARNPALGHATILSQSTEERHARGVRGKLRRAPVCPVRTNLRKWCVTLSKHREYVRRPIKISRRRDKVAKKLAKYVQSDCKITNRWRAMLKYTPFDSLPDDNHR